MHIPLIQVFKRKAPEGLRKELAGHDQDRWLAAQEEPPLGAHLITPRFAYQHHGIYVGGGLVVHYSAFAKHWRCGPVEEIPLARFAGGHPLWIRPARAGAFEGVDVVRRARSRLGENRYAFWSNNCEHLSEWCVNGEHRSLQVEHFLAPLRRLSAAVTDLLRSLEPLWT
ncbi:MAG: lecithin retinol acyltransferase family protein [Gammaproteobacteria bacterium]|nr:lecithin retinol acyltransferase family protein [Gammaproteobacteria bacterium]